MVSLHPRSFLIPLAGKKDGALHLKADLFTLSAVLDMECGEKLLKMPFNSICCSKSNIHF